MENARNLAPKRNRRSVECFEELERMEVPMLQSCSLA